MDAVDSVANLLREFAKDSIRLVKRCHKPDHKEFTKVAAQTALDSSSSSSSSPSTKSSSAQADPFRSGPRFPFMDSETESLTPGEVKQLHDLYRQVVTGYTLLSKALRKLSIDEDQLINSVHES